MAVWWWGTGGCLKASACDGCATFACIHVAHALRLHSNRNQMRVSASSIQFSIILMLATSSTPPQMTCASRIKSASRSLSLSSSASISDGATISASFPAKRAKHMMCGTDLRGATPDLADTLGYRVCRGKELLRLVVQNYVIVAKVWSGHVPVKI